MNKVNKSPCEIFLVCEMAQDIALNRETITWDNYFIGQKMRENPKTTQILSLGH